MCPGRGVCPGCLCLSRVCVFVQGVCPGGCPGVCVQRGVYPWLCVRGVCPGDMCPGGGVWPGGFTPPLAVDRMTDARENATTVVDDKNVGE